MKRFVVFRIGQKALCGVKNRKNQISSENSCEISAGQRAIQFSKLNPKIKRRKALCGPLNKPQSALWYFEMAIQRSVVFRILLLFYEAKRIGNSYGI